MGWSDRLSNKPRRRRYSKVSTPDPIGFHVALQDLAKRCGVDYEDQANLLRDRYSGQYGRNNVESWIRAIRAVHAQGGGDLRFAYEVSQRKGWKRDVKSLFQESFPNLATEFGDSRKALCAFVQYYLDDERKGILAQRISSLIRVHGPELHPWISAVQAVYKRSNGDQGKAFAISQGSGWRMDVKSLFREVYPNLAYEYDKSHGST